MMVNKAQSLFELLVLILAHPPESLHLVLIGRHNPPIRSWGSVWTKPKPCTPSGLPRSIYRVTWTPYVASTTTWPLMVRRPSSAYGGQSRKPLKIIAGCGFFALIFQAAAYQTLGDLKMTLATIRAAMRDPDLDGGISQGYFRANPCLIYWMEADLLSTVQTNGTAKTRSIGSIGRRRLYHARGVQDQKEGHLG